jgi:hypothetical protein
MYMISQEVTQRNVWPYLIGLCLILLAFLLGWMANEALQMDGPQVNISSGPVAAPSTGIHPADRKFFTNNYTFSGSSPGDTGSVPDVDPADRKYFTHNYMTSDSAPTSIESTQAIDPADRKFFPNEQNR